MKVTDLRTETYRWPRAKPVRNGRYIYTHAGLNVVKVYTDEGIVGIGFSGGVTETEDIGRNIAEYLKQVVVDQDPFDTERIWDDMWQPKLVGRRGITTRVISAIDMALWDIKGKACELPLYKMLGGYTDRVPVYIAGGYYEDDKGLDELAVEMKDSVLMGARAIKMKIGGAPINEDVERVRVVRDTVGDEIKLMVDANCAYRYYEAIDIATKIEKYNISWFEEPVNPDDYKGYKMMAQATSIPVATGENEYTRYGFRDLIENRCAAILQPDALVMGGITEFMKVAAMAQAHDLPIAPHGNQDVHVHLVAAIPNGLTTEYYSGSTDPMWGKTFKETLIVDNGYLHPPNRPGLGIELNEDALISHRVA
uniref:L-alanine-dl-glutamate epimerase and related enzymes of enolase superfamily n=1 Tax=uncultured Chloroflexi bacterium HF0500_03M05 TaxID=710737 RepID=E0XY77_9CHLR|nr:l-alanine-dl-glutamate epimerase and related enzymes of enolase superfamily [uncultured Chloroflexi bacterium HF0500_03M05]